MIFIPEQPPYVESSSIRTLTAWIYRQFQAISDAQSIPDALVFKANNKAPANPQANQVMAADGVNWNPGSGAGLYLYDGSAWSKL